MFNEIPNKSIISTASCQTNQYVGTVALEDEIKSYTKFKFRQSAHLSATSSAREESTEIGDEQLNNTERWTLPRNTRGRAVYRTFGCRYRTVAWYSCRALLVGGRCCRWCRMVVNQ